MNVRDIDALIERRLLVNYRVDPEVAANLLPAPFTPRLIGGYAMAGICLIHLRQGRLAGMPSVFGIETQGAAHRIAVNWARGDGPASVGVYIPRRDSDSRLITAATRGHWRHTRATFAITEDSDAFDIAMDSSDGGGSVRVVGRPADALEGSALGTLQDAYGFFRDGGPGFSPTAGGNFAGVELIADSWQLTPAVLDDAQSSWFNDRVRFPSGSAEIDSALLMRRTASRWRAVPDVAA
ncbi:MAG: DUF2071 domain-containing protein [Candidatus Dormibacteria bacterium]